MCHRPIHRLVFLAVLFPAKVCVAGESPLFQETVPPPGTTGNADNVPFIGGRDPQGNPVRLAKQTGHVSNYDESKVPAYSLPDPLKMKDGRDVTSVDQWQVRRGEILRFYEERIYGRVPENAPTVKWEVTDTESDSRDGTAVTKRIEGMVGDGTALKLRLALHLPQETNGPVQFLAMVAAGPVYELMGAAGLGTDQLPALDEPIVSGHLAFHYHSQGHRALPEDWRLFLQFAERHDKSRQSSSP